MTSVLFLGNSHLSAIKLAYQRDTSLIGPRARFYCARGADLYFTSVEEGRIVAPPTKEPASLDIGEEELADRFWGFAPEHAWHYVGSKRPLAPVAEQFKRTGGTEDIDLADVRAIFYVAGVSPYDFIENGEPVGISLSRPLRRELLGGMLDTRYLLRDLVLAIRRQCPQCAHYLIGSPLRTSNSLDISPETRRVVEGERAAVRDLADHFLVDRVFRPDDALLDHSWLATKPEFCIGGKQESEAYQGVDTTKTDDAHMNSSYGRIVLQRFVGPLLDWR